MLLWRSVAKLVYCSILYLVATGSHDTGVNDGIFLLHAIITVVVITLFRWSRTLVLLVGSQGCRYHQHQL